MKRGKRINYIARNARYVITSSSSFLFPPPYEEGREKEEGKEEEKTRDDRVRSYPRNRFLAFVRISLRLENCVFGSSMRFIERQRENIGEKSAKRKVLQRGGQNRRVNFCIICTSGRRKKHLLSLSATGRRRGGEGAMTERGAPNFPRGENDDPKGKYDDV